MWIYLFSILSILGTATLFKKQSIDEWTTRERGQKFQSGLITNSIRKGDWDLAKDLIKAAQSDGLFVEVEVRKGVHSVQNEINEILKLVEIKEKELQTLSPAFQWAESSTHIYLQIKLAYRWSSPGALTLDQQNVTITAHQVYFSGIGTHSSIPKKYILDLQLKSSIDPEESEWTWGAVGKMSMTLKKQTEGKWGSLTLSQNKIPNMFVWWEMKEKIEADESAAAKQGEAQSNKTSAASSSTPTPPSSSSPLVSTPSTPADAPPQLSSTLSRKKEKIKRDEL